MLAFNGFSVAGGGAVFDIGIPRLVAFVASVDIDFAVLNEPTRDYGSFSVVRSFLRIKAVFLPSYVYCLLANTQYGTRL